jgi:hypothetical protein
MASIYDNWLIQDLIKELRKCEIKSPGRKSQLIERLIALDSIIDYSYSGKNQMLSYQVRYNTRSFNLALFLSSMVSENYWQLHPNLSNEWLPKLVSKLHAS